MSLLVCSWFELINFYVSYEVCLLVGSGEQMTPGSVLGCSENILDNNNNILVFVGLHFFTYLLN